MEKIPKNIYMNISKMLQNIINHNVMFQKDLRLEILNLKKEQINH